MIVDTQRIEDVFNLFVHEMDKKTRNSDPTIADVKLRLKGCILFYAIDMTVEEVIAKILHSKKAEDYHRWRIGNVEKSGQLVTEDMVMLMQKMRDCLTPPGIFN